MKKFDKRWFGLELLETKPKGRRGVGVKSGGYKYFLADLDNLKNERIDELKKLKSNDLEDMVYGIKLTFDEIVDIFNLKYIAESTTGCTLLPGV